MECLKKAQRATIAMTRPVSPEDALKACPFCGDDEELRVCQPLYLSGYWAVHCGCCGGEMQSESRVGAVVDWNTRTDPPKTVLDEEVVAVPFGVDDGQSIAAKVKICRTTPPSVLDQEVVRALTITTEALVVALGPWSGEALGNGVKLIAANRALLTRLKDRGTD